eukprot:g1558.t1
MGGANWSSEQSLNAFEDNGWAMSYTSLHRLARFPAVVRLGERYNITFKGTNPRNMRFALSGAPPDAGVTVHLQCGSPEQVEVRRAWSGQRGVGAVVASLPENREDALHPDAFPNGANVWNNARRSLRFVVKGQEPVLLRTMNSVQVSLKLATTVESFYDKGGTREFATRVAFTLGIPSHRIRIVSVIQVSRRRLRLLQANSAKPTLAVDFLVVEDIQTAENVTNSTGTTGTGTNTEDPPGSELVADEANMTAVQDEQEATALALGGVAATAMSLAMEELSSIASKLTTALGVRAGTSDGNIATPTDASNASNVTGDDAGDDTGGLGLDMFGSILAVTAPVQSNNVCCSKM